jgi:hypothetical protein
MKLLPYMMILNTITKQYFDAKRLAMTSLIKDMVKDLHTEDNLEDVMNCLIYKPQRDGRR